MGECAYIILHKELEHLWSLVSMGVLGQPSVYKIHSIVRKS